MGVIVVERPGLLSTLQDLGRPGWQHVGVTPGGVMDSDSGAVANALVGNPPEAAVLEITLHGPSLCFEAGSWLAIAGADLLPELDGDPIPTWRPVWAPAGSRLGFGQARRGCRAYLAVAGGFSAHIVLGGRGTDLRGSFGGLAGRALRAGDRLEVGSSQLPVPEKPDRLHAPDWSVRWNTAPNPGVPVCLRLIPGPAWAALSADGQRALAIAVYRVGAHADRMGLRLTGPSLELSAKDETLSSGVTFGTLQLPPGGQPILLGVDRQTTGGYPILGTVASIDHPRLAQLCPGDAVGFEPVTVERAQALYREHALRLRRLRVGLSERWPLNLLQR